MIVIGDEHDVVTSQNGIEALLAVDCGIRGFILETACLKMPLVGCLKNSIHCFHADLSHF